MPRISAKLFLMSKKQDLVVARNRKWHSSNVEQSEKEIYGRYKTHSRNIVGVQGFSGHTVLHVHCFI